MILQSLLITAALALGGAPGEIPESTNSGLNLLAPGNPHGPAGGSWELPTPAGPGAIHGLLRAPNGTPLFAIHGHISLGGPGPGTGVIHGVLVRLVGPNPGPVAQVHGPWLFDPNGPDRFAVKFVIPAGGGNPPQLIGAMHGVWVDPFGPLPPAGAFQGVWHL